MASIDTQLKFSAGLTKDRVDRGRNVRLRLRRAIGKWLEEYIRDRVKNKGQGAYGTLRGYSDSPVLIAWPRPSGLKRIKQPVGGVPTRQGMFFGKGYEEYKQMTGQVWDKFTLENTGDLWRDWKYFESNSLTAPILLGFSDAKNSYVADVERNEHGRPGIFALDKSGRRKLVKFIELWLKENI